MIVEYEFVDSVELQVVAIVLAELKCGPSNFKYQRATGCIYPIDDPYNRIVLAEQVSSIVVAVRYTIESRIRAYQPFIETAIEKFRRHVSYCVLARPGDWEAQEGYMNGCELLGRVVSVGRVIPVQV